MSARWGKPSRIYAWIVSGSNHRWSERERSMVDRGDSIDGRLGRLYRSYHVLARLVDRSLNREQPIAYPRACIGRDSMRAHYRHCEIVGSKSFLSRVLSGALKPRWATKKTSPPPASMPISRSRSSVGCSCRKAYRLRQCFGRPLVFEPQNACNPFQLSIETRVA